MSVRSGSPDCLTLDLCRDLDRADSASVARTSSRDLVSIVRLAGDELVLVMLLWLMGDVVLL